MIRRSTVFIKKMYCIFKVVQFFDFGTNIQLNHSEFKWKYNIIPKSYTKLTADQESKCFWVFLIFEPLFIFKIISGLPMRLTSFLRVFFVDHRHIAEQFSYITKGAPPLNKNIEANLKPFLGNTQLWNK